MSDETTTPGGWQTGPGGNTAAGPDTNPAPAEERVGFCQNCGKPLTSATMRAVGSSVFCEPCLHARVAAPGAAGYVPVPPYASAGAPVAPGEPSPVLAAILGLIPGVGAMYNGQFAKGIVHLVIFAIVVSLADNVHGIFGLFVAGWIVYMSFEAYHTAVARRDGLPLPNAFGFNDIGERMGFGRSWSAPAVPRPGVDPSTQAASTATAAAAVPGSVPVAAAPAGPASDWIGYVPPTAFANAAAQHEAFAASTAAQVREQAMRDAGFYAQMPEAAYAPYAQTYSGAAYSSVPLAAAVPFAAPPVPEMTPRRFPVGALWLIGLGVLILLANVIPNWKLSERWWLPLLFAGLSIWTFTRRVRSGAKLVCILRWPVLLMVLAIMLGLHAANFEVTFGLTCSVLLIVFGAILLLERTAGTASLAAPYAAPIASVVPQPEEPQARATWATPVPTQPDVPPAPEDLR